MRSRISFFVLFAAALLTAATSCQKEDRSPRITLGETEVAVPWDGGSFTVSYVVENPTEGAEPSVSWDESVDWVHDFQVDPLRYIITFNVDRSYVEEARSTTVLYLTPVPRMLQHS